MIYANFDITSRASAGTMRPWASRCPADKLPEFERRLLRLHGRAARGAFHPLVEIDLVRQPSMS